MLTVRKKEDRGTTHTGWLNSRHTFSFGNYYDSQHMGFGSLRVINDDKVVAGAGFGMHPHDNMEIISYVIEGALEHKDSMGNGSIIHPGEVQRLSAGTGITHSEYNHSKKAEVHFLQIWIVPNKRNVTPSYEQKAFSDEAKNENFCLLVSETGRKNSLSIHQDIDISLAFTHSTKGVSYSLSKNRMLWAHVISGSTHLNQEQLQAGDGVAVVKETELCFQNSKNAEIIVFDMKMQDYSE